MSHDRVALNNTHGKEPASVGPLPWIMLSSKP